jgi:hypothetical protein
MPFHHLVELASSLLHHGKHAADAATAVQTPTVHHSTGGHPVAHHPSSTHPLQFGEWVDGAHSGYAYERLNGEYTGNYVKR